MEYKEAYQILANPKNVRFTDALKIAEFFFGPCRRKGSHHVFKTPWPANPRVNLQNVGKLGKEYQMKQLVQALKKLEEMTK